MTHPRSEPSIPLILALAEDPDTQSYREALQADRLVSASYDAKSQTSVIPAHAGTYLTYRTTGTGNVFSSDNDQKKDDT